MFLLYHKKDKVYPESIKIGGNLYFINADFRNILRIFDMLNDLNIPEHKKIEKLTVWFFEDGLPGNISPVNVIDAFIGFVSRQPPPSAPPSEKGAFDNRSEEETERQFCYNFDAEEIYAGFISEYGIDLICVDFLHWHKFRILLNNLSPDSAFKKKIELRFMDMNSIGNIGNKSAELAQAKESVQLPADNLNDFEETENMQEIIEFNEIWGKAGNN